MFDDIKYKTIIKYSYECPYCHGNILDGEHTVSNFKDYQVIGCPGFPKNEKPLFINENLWLDCIENK